MTLNTDLSSLSSAIYKVKKGGGSNVEWTATVENTTSGIIYYNVQEGDFNESGIYHIHAQLTFSDGSVYTSEGRQFKVYDLYYD